MTVNVYKFYGSEIAPQDVASQLDRYKKADPLRIMKKIMEGKAALDRNFFIAVITFVLSVFAALMLVKMSPNLPACAFSFFAFCIYGSMFTRSWQEYSRKVITTRQPGPL